MAGEGFHVKQTLSEEPFGQRMPLWRLEPIFFAQPLDVHSRETGLSYQTRPKPTFELFHVEQTVWASVKSRKTWFHVEPTQL